MVVIRLFQAVINELLSRDDNLRLLTSGVQSFHRKEGLLYLKIINLKAIFDNFVRQYLCIQKRCLKCNWLYCHDYPRAKP